MLAEKQKQADNISLIVKLSSSAYSDEGLLPWLYERFKALRIEPTHMIFEVTEKDAAGHISQIDKFTRTLKKMRCRVVLSKFGLADDPFRIFKTIPADIIKVSPELTKRVASDSAVMAQLTEMVQKARELEKPILAPFVETAEAMAMIFQCGFDFAQGNFLQEPDVVMSFDFSDTDESIHSGQAAV